MLLKLPDEVLLNIALRVDTKGTHGLSLTCRRLLSIAQEALIKQGRVTPKHIWNYVALLQQHPGWAHEITHLGLGSLKFSDMSTLHAVDHHVKSTITKSEFLACCKSISNAVTAASADNPDLWLKTWASGKDFSSMGLSILLAQCPKLEALSVSTGFIDSELLLFRMFCDNGEPRIVGQPEHWHTTVRRLLQKRLRGLEVTGKPGTPLFDRNRAFRSRQVERIHLTTFRHLRHLIVPYDCIITQMSTSPHEILPASLVHLRVDYCNPTDPCGSEFFVDELMIDSEAFPYMHSIELRFDCSSSHLFLSRIHEAGINAIRRWQESTRVEFVTACKEPPTREYSRVDLVAVTRSWQGPGPTLDEDLDEGLRL